MNENLDISSLVKIGLAKSDQQLEAVALFKAQIAQFFKEKKLNRGFLSDLMRITNENASTNKYGNVERVTFSQVKLFLERPDATIDRFKIIPSAFDLITLYKDNAKAIVDIWETFAKNKSTQPTENELTNHAV